MNINGNFKSSLSFVCNVADFLFQAGVRILLICIICRTLTTAISHFNTVATLPFCNLTSILKLELIYIFEFQRLIV